MGLDEVDFEEIAQRIKKILVDGDNFYITSFSHRVVINHVAKEVGLDQKVLFDILEELGYNSEFRKMTIKNFAKWMSK